MVSWCSSWRLPRERHLVGSLSRRQRRQVSLIRFGLCILLVEDRHSPLLWWQQLPVLKSESRYRVVPVIATVDIDGQAIGDSWKNIALRSRQSRFISRLDINDPVSWPVRPCIQNICTHLIPNAI